MDPSASVRLSRRRVLATACALATGLALTACAGAAGTPAAPPTAAVSQADIDEAMQTPTELTFWTWVPDIEKEVALFQKKYPAIKVNVVNAGQGEPQYTKLRTALKAGNGAPDVAQIEFQYIPTFSITEEPASTCGPYGAEAKHVDSSSTGPGTRSRAPTGRSGPTRRTPARWACSTGTTSSTSTASTSPKTWDEFADGGPQTLHAADPTCTSPTSRANQNGVLAWGCSGRPAPSRSRSTAPTPSTSTSTTPTSKKVGALLGGPRPRRASSRPTPTSPTAWYQGLNRGKYATWLTAAWGPVFLTGSAQVHQRQVARRAAAAVGRRQAGLRQLGRIDDRGHDRHQEPDRRGEVRGVPQHRPGVDEDVRDRAVPLPGDEGAAGRPGASPSRSRRSTAASRSTRCSPTSAAPWTCSSSGRRSWTRPSTTGTRRWASPSPTRPTSTPPWTQWQERISDYAREPGLHGHAVSRSSAARRRSTESRHPPREGVPP